MSSLPFLSVLIVYPMTLFGDGCILIAIALAATVGGRPLIWGVSFAGFHALYGIIGMLVAGEIATYSSMLGEVFVLLGSVILLRHFMHHSLHHQAGDDCSCENHKPIPVSTRAIISTASLSLVVGGLISTIVLIGNLERTPILRALDSLPGVVAALLTLLCCFSLYHITHELFSLSRTLEGLALCLSLALAFWMGYRVHRHRSQTASSSLTQISQKRSGQH
jgi:hypothetical protein